MQNLKTMQAFILKKYVKTISLKKYAKTILKLCKLLSKVYKKCPVSEAEFEISAHCLDYCTKNPSYCS